MHRPARYNAKARGLHKKGKTTKRKSTNAPEPADDAPAGLPSQTQAYADANADILERKSEEEKEADRRLKLRQQMLEESNSRASSKKKKRLDKYIDKKLKKDERLELFEKLAKSQAQLPSTLALQSSSTLGTGRVSTHQARQDQAEDRQVRRVMDGTAGSRKRKRGGNTNYSSVVRTGSGSEDEDDELDEAEEERMDVDEDEEPGHSPTNPVLVIEDSAPPAPERPTSKAVVGGALKRNADGSVAAPKMLARKDKGQRTILQRWKRPSQQQPEFQLPVESDSSFDSSDSANDSSDEEDDASEESSGDDDEESGEDKSGSDSGSGEDSDEEDEEEEAPAKRKLGDFKSWAMNQLSAAKGYVAPISTDAPDDIPPPSLAPPAKKRKLSPPPDGLVHGPLGETLVLPSTSLAQSLQSQSSSSSSKKYVSVKRPADVEEARLLLPIVGEEQPIMEAILLNTVVVICGETGSGKTTQVPQFLYEAGFGSPGSDNPGMIGITQPRRVAAISMSQRVSHELSLSSSIVSYQIRYDATVSPSTSIKFMTDGVLLRELASDFLLTKYSVVVIDEAHERSVNTDILVGVLSRVVRLREEMWKSDGQVKPLRLIIMSATLRVTDFTHNATLFPTPPPVITVSARQHPVTIHFNRRTKPDYVSESIRKTAKIHARLPPGGILIFLTGQNEIMGVCRKLEERYGWKAIEGRRKRRREGVKSRDAQAFFRDEDPVVVRPAQVPLEAEDMELGAALAEDLADDVDGNAETDEEALDTDDDELDEELGIDAEESEVPMHIVPLYSLLPSEKQMKVFEPPPEGHRLVVVSTNVAETSLTIPNIRYVVDCGRAKERKYDLASSVQSFQIGFTSKASASQRAGRAGRTGPGHCYRLYSSALYESYFPSFSEPEILRMPIEGLVLHMKSMHVDTVVNFPFPTAPERGALSRAEKVLTRLGALSSSGGGSGSGSGVIGGGQITDMGRTMALFPLSPRFAKMLASGRQHGCLPYIVAIVAGLSVGDPFLREEAVGGEEGEEGEEEVDGDMRHLTGAQARAKEMRRLRRKAFFESQQLHASLGKSTSDMFRLLSVVGAYEYAGGGSEFCAEHFVRPKAMEEIHKLRAQISNIVAVNFPGTDAGFIPNLPPPKDKQLKVLRQLFASGFIDQVAVRKDLVSQDGAGLKHATSKNVPYRALGVSEDVFIHPSSVLSNTAPPDYIVFHELVRTSRTWIKGLTVVNPAWLASLGAKTGLCTFSKPFKNRTGEELVLPRFGPEGWELPAIKAGSVQ